MRDELGLLGSAAESEAIAASVPDTGGVYLVPAFVGLGAPHWDAHARGAIVGLTRGTGRAHLVRAALEAIAYQTRDVVDVVAAEAGLGLTELRIDGGTAYLAGLAVGLWRDRSEVATLWQADRRFEPALPGSEWERRYAGWLRAVERSRDWARE